MSLDAALAEARHRIALSLLAELVRNFRTGATSSSTVHCSERAATLILSKPAFLH